MRPSSPFKGLNAFDDSELDALLFFGREREREIVVANLIASRLTVLYGPSGVGKSSLLRAAVARSLRELPEKPLVVVFSRWSDDPATALTEGLAEASGETLNGSPLEALEQVQQERDVYLVLDQAEEYFLYHADDGGPGSFAEALPAVLGAPLRINVLVSLREDSLAKLDRFTGRIPGLFANTLRLDRLDRPAARAAIILPVERFAELTGKEVSVERDLVERVLDEVGAGQIESALGGLGTVEGAEDGARIEAPYLQLVMQRLWEEERAAGSDVLRLGALERLGGAQHIVEEHLHGAMAELTPEQKDVAARLFNHLVTPSGTKIAHEVLDLADFGQVPAEELLPLLATLAERRILRSLEEGGDLRYEIFHDVLAQPVLAWRTRHRTEREIEGQLAEAQRRRSRFQRVLAIGLIGLAVVAAVTAFALVQRGNANEQAQDAEARRLDASAAALLEDDAELSLLLSAESARMSPAATAEEALRAALLTSRVRDVYAADGPIAEVAVAPDGRHLGYVTEDGAASLRDATTGEEVAAKEIGAGGGLSFSLDGGTILVHGDAGPAQTLDVATGETRCVLDADHGAAADSTLVGPFAVTVRNGRGYVWDTTTCKLLRGIGQVGQTAVSVVASEDGRRVAFLSGREALVVGVPSGRRLYRLQHPGEITSLAFSSDGAWVATGGRDRLARIWNGQNGKRVRELRGHRGQVLDVAIAPGGSEVATASTDGTARIWETATGIHVATLFGHTQFVDSVEFSPDGRALVTASRDRTARTWTLNGQRLATLTGHTDSVGHAHFSPDGFVVFTGSLDGSVRLWEAGTRPDLTEGAFDAPDGPQDTATSPDGNVIAQVADEIVRLAHDDTTTDLVGHRLPVNSVAFSPDGLRLVSAGRDDDAILWDVATGKALRVLRGHFGSVSDARFSPDGRWIVTAGPRSAGLWRASDGELVKLLFGPEGPFTAAAFSPDSRTIVTISGDGLVTGYDCRICGEIPELLELADERLRATGRTLTPEERELYLG